MPRSATTHEQIARLKAENETLKTIITYLRFKAQRPTNDYLSLNIVLKDCIYKGAVDGWDINPDEIFDHPEALEPETSSSVWSDSLDVLRERYQRLAKTYGNSTEHLANLNSAYAFAKDCVNSRQSRRA